MSLADAQKQITELTAALELTKSSKEDALAERTATIAALREQLREMVEALTKPTTEMVQAARIAEHDAMFPDKKPNEHTWQATTPSMIVKMFKAMSNVALARIKGEPT